MDTGFAVWTLGITALYLTHHWLVATMLVVFLFGAAWMRS